MDKKKVFFIAQFPPPIHGLSKAVETLYHSKLADEFIFQKADITSNKRFLGNLLKVFTSRADLYYFTISQTRGGNLRDLVILFILHLQHKRCLIHLHGGYYRTLVDKDMPAWQRKLNYRAVSRLDGAIVLGPSLKWIFRGMLPDDRIYTVPNCVDDEYLMSDEMFARKLTSLKRRTIRHVLYLSNFIREKGYPEVLEMANLEKKNVDAGNERRFHFDFAGKFYNENDQKEFMQYIQEHKLEEYVTYHGVVTGDKKRQLLWNCDLFALLTRYPKEGQPISILEAMGNGMVILTTDHAGIPDIVHDGINGIIMQNPSFRAESLLKKIRYISYSDIAQVNRKEIRKSYNQEQYTENMRNAFNLCLYK